MNDTSVLIYDGNCFSCSAASKAIEKLKDVSIIPWQDTESQEFLRAQFGEVPMAMFLVDSEEGNIYGGKAAAEELSRRASMPSLLEKLVSEEYTTIAKITGILSGRETSTDDFHEVYQMRADAEELFNELQTAAGTNAPIRD